MNTRGHIDRCPAAFAAALVCLAVLLLNASTSRTAAQEIRTNPLPAAIPGTLDGMQFVGPMGVEDEKDPEQDVFTFKDGKFVSKSCAEWGFSPAPYWIRRDADGIRFLAELASEEHGRMRYEGVFDGKQMNAVAYWKKERWYWTIERTYRFRGRPAKPAP